MQPGDIVITHPDMFMIHDIYTPYLLDTLEKIVDDIETKLQNSLDREVPSSQIGTYAMDKLKKVDEVAYVRFASVYREFKDINTFMDELNKIKAERNR